MPKLNKCIEALLESYNNRGHINPAGEANLPSKRSIESILRELTELLLPGFGEMESLDHNKLSLITAERVNKAVRNLEQEVEKSVAFGLRLEGKSNESFRGCRAGAEILVTSFFNELPAIRLLLEKDIRAALDGDPAAKSIEEVILSYPGLEAIMVHRMAHFFLG